MTEDPRAARAAGLLRAMVNLPHESRRARRAARCVGLPEDARCRRVHPGAPQGQGARLRFGGEGRPPEAHVGGDAERIRYALQRLEALSRGARDLRGHLNCVAQAVQDFLEVDWTAVTLCHDGLERVIATTAGEVDNSLVSIHGTVTNAVMTTGAPVVIQAPGEAGRFGLLPQGYEAYLGIPLAAAGGRVIGTVCSFARSARRFSADDVAIASILADRAGALMESFDVFEEQRFVRRELERELQERDADLARHDILAQRERFADLGEFTARIVHDLRSPLTIINLGLATLSGESQLASTRTLARILSGEAERLQTMLSEILNYSKPQRTKLTSVDLGGFLRRELSLLESMSGNPSAPISLELPDAPVIALADEDKLRQVLLNLISNAREAGGQPQRIVCSVDPAGDGEATFRVRNGGTPIPAAILSRLGEPFVTTKPGGTGLGIPIVKRIVTALGGRVWITSDTERGTVVSVALTTGSLSPRES